MEFNDKFFIELAASFAAIVTVWIYGNRSRNAPIVGMFGQMLRWWLTISQSMWGLIPLNVVMVIILKKEIKKKNTKNTIKKRNKKKDVRNEISLDANY